MWIAARNITDQPVQIDSDGHRIGGWEWGVVDQDDSHVKDAFEKGRLVAHTGVEPGPGQNPEAVRAYQDAQQRNQTVTHSDAETVEEPGAEVASAAPGEEA